MWCNLQICVLKATKLRSVSCLGPFTYLFGRLTDVFVGKFVKGYAGHFQVNVISRTGL